MAAPASRNTSILIIDDDENTRLSLREYLTDCDYVVLTAGNGVSGLERFRSESPDLVFVNLRMPVMDGIDTLAELRRIAPETPTIVLSGTGDVRDAVRAMRMGAWDFVFKPIQDMSGLVETIEQTLGLARAQEDARCREESLEKKLEERAQELADTHETLRKSLGFSDSLLRAMLDGLTVMDSKGAHIEANPAFCSMTGYARNELIGVSAPYPYWPSEEVAAQMEEIRQRLDRGESQPHESLFRRKTGELFPVLVSPSRVVSDDGASVNYVVTYKDITERKRAEQILQAERDRLEIVTQSAGAGLAIISKDYDVTWTNRVLGGLFGEVVGKKCHCAYNSEEQPCDDCRMPDIFSGKIEQASWEKQLLDTSGSPVWMEIIATAVKDGQGKVESALEVLVPITARKKAEEAQRQAEERLRTVLATAPVVLFSYDMEGRLLYVSDNLERIYGIPPAKLGEEPAFWHTVIHPDDKDYVLTEWRRCIREKAPFLAQFRLFHGITGEEVHIERRTSINRNAQGQPESIVGVSIDITERKRAEEESRSREQQLIQADKMISLGTLVAGVAHEVNNPNQLITMSASLLERVWEGTQPVLDRYYEEHGDFLVGGMDYTEAREEVPALISRIEGGADRIKFIVKELRDFARQSPAEMTEDVDINAVFRSAIVLLSNMIKKSTKRFHQDYCNHCPKVKGNFRRLEQVVVNLIQNACQALPDDDKGILVSTVCDPRKPMVTLKVRDEGTGIAKEHMRFIMDPFFTTKRDSGGTGLGLSVSSMIVRDHGGTLRFESAPGQGTTAVVTLPLVPPAGH